MSIWRLGYVEVRSLDLERDSQFWREIVGSGGLRGRFKSP